MKYGKILYQQLTYSTSPLSNISHYQWRFSRGSMEWRQPLQKSLVPPLKPPQMKIWYLVYTLYIWKLLVPPLAHPMKPLEPPQIQMCRTATAHYQTTMSLNIQSTPPINHQWNKGYLGTSARDFNVIHQRNSLQMDGWTEHAGDSATTHLISMAPTNHFIGNSQVCTTCTGMHWTHVLYFILQNNIPKVGPHSCHIVLSMFRYCS